MTQKSLSTLKEKADLLPKRPGCYLMKDAQQKIIYIGKAKSLKNRVSSYFNNSSGKSIKTLALIERINDFDFIVCQSDMEAFILENNLIKKHSPKYNISLKDDRSYPYVVIDWNHDFPQLSYARRPRKKKGREIIGPFPHGSNISGVLEILRKSFLLRDCTDRDFATRKKPCLLYQMKQCAAPCVGLQSKKDYIVGLKKALSFFGQGGAARVIKELEEQMLEAGNSEAFERAIQLRDGLAQLKEFLKERTCQNMEWTQLDSNIDFINFWVEGEELDWAIYSMRNGLLLGEKNFNFFRPFLEEELKEELFHQIVDYYSHTEDSLPDRIIVPEELFSEELQDYWNQLLTNKMEFKKETKRYQALMKLVKEHAREVQRVRLNKGEDGLKALVALRDLLQMKCLPRHIECVDIAIFQGSSPTASQVVFRDGRPDKSSYRHYALAELPEGNNDFKMMQEFFERRLQGREELPDLFVVDGGLLQLNAVQKIMDELGKKVPLVGLAKERAEKGSEERLIIPQRSNPYLLKKNMSLFRLMVSLRDEAHRFARRLHHRKEEKRILKN